MTLTAEARAFWARAREARAFEERHAPVAAERAIEPLPIVLAIFTSPLPRLKVRRHGHDGGGFTCGCGGAFAFGVGQREIQCTCGTRHVKD